MVRMTTLKLVMILSYQKIKILLLVTFQTGSGKTFTITGGAERYVDRGLIPRSLSYIFEYFEKVSFLTLLTPNYVDAYAMLPGGKRQEETSRNHNLRFSLLCSESHLILSCLPSHILHLSNCCFTTKI